MKQKTCPNCTQKFQCGANEKQCWCINISLSPLTLAKLKESFVDCLCEKCLTEYLKKEEGNTDNELD